MKPFKLIVFFLSVLIAVSLVAASPAYITWRGKLWCVNEEGNCVEAYETDLIAYSDQGTTLVWQVDVSAANIDYNGSKLDLDADNDTSITVDTDDQVDFEVGGADEFRITTTGPAIVEASVLAITAGTTITPTTAYQPITSTAEFTADATTAIWTGTVVGQLLILVNENASDVIHIPDGANTNLTGQADLGNDDTLWLIWDGADWLELGQANNSP